jgi:hypothetical protein
MSASRRYATTMLLALLTAVPVGAQGTAHVDPLHPVYHDLDLLAAAGLIRSMVVGQRPYTYREVGRLLSEAEASSDASSVAGAWSARILDRWRSLRTSGRMERRAMFPSVDVEWTGLDSPPRAVPHDATGNVDAIINPLAGYRQGRDYADGQTMAVEVRHAAQLGGRVAFEIAPRVARASPRDAVARIEGSVERAYVNARVGTAIVTVGRDIVFFGQGME